MSLPGLSDEVLTKLDRNDIGVGTHEKVLLATLMLFSTYSNCGSWKWEDIFRTEPDPSQYGVMAIGVGISAYGLYNLKKRC